MSASKKVHDLPALLTLVARRWERAKGTRRGAAPRTIANYTRNLARLEREVPTLLGEPEAVRTRLERWRARDQKRFDAGEISASKIQGDLSALKQFYDVLVEERIMAFNPASALGGVPKAEAVPSPIPHDDLTKLLAKIDPATRAGQRDALLIELGMRGMRNEEVCNLTVDGVEYDPQHDTLVLTFWEKGNRLSKPMVLRRSTAAMLAQYMLTERPEKFHLPEQAVADDPDGAWLAAFREYPPKRHTPGTRRVFHTDSGTPLYTRWLDRMFGRYRNAAEVSDYYTFHSLRHRFITDVVDLTDNIKDACALARHRDIRTTMTYVERKRSAQVNILERLPKAGGSHA